MSELPVEERILAGLFLCSSSSNEILEALKPEWNEQAALSITDKFIFLGQPTALEQVFPWHDLLSAGTDPGLFAASFFVQPSLFLRVRPGKKEKVIHQLANAGIPFEFNGENCLVLPAAAKLDEVLAMNKDVVVQDYSSQRVGELLARIVRPSRSDDSIMVRRGPSDHNGRSDDSSDDWRVWDCCAASGGKSLLAVDTLGDIKLTVSDIRESILVNLRKRFAEGGITRYESFVANLADDAPVNFLNTKNGKKLFDLVIADVPCSGSGTWSRTPEQLFFFNTTKIEGYAFLQKKIVTNAVQYLKEGGYFLYITCSVFRKENEEVVAYIKEKFHLREVKMEFLKGYNIKADTLFAALLQRSV